jgi:hypothetical protein
MVGLGNVDKKLHNFYTTFLSNFQQNFVRVFPGNCFSRPVGNTPGPAEEIFIVSFGHLSFLNRSSFFALIFIKE